MSPRIAALSGVWLGEGCSYLAEAHEHVIEVAKNDATYRRQKYNAEDNHERKYERGFRQGLAVLFPWPEPQASHKVLDRMHCTQ